MDVDEERIAALEAKVGELTAALKQRDGEPDRPPDMNALVRERLDRKRRPMFQPRPDPKDAA